MAIYQEARSGNWVVKTRDCQEKQFAVTVNKCNLMKYGVAVPESITKRTAQELERAILMKVDTPEIQTECVMLSEAVKRFLETRLVSSHQQSHYKLVIEKYLLTFITDKPISQITMHDLERFKSYLAQGRSPVSLRGYLIDTKVFFRWAANTELIIKNPAENIKLPPRNRKPVEYLNQEQVKQLLEAVRGLLIEPAIIGFLNLGVRRSELTNIQWRDVNLQNNMVLVRGTKSNQAVRGIPISDDFKQYLIEHRNGSPYVFSNETNDKLSVWMLSSALRRFLKRKRINFHLTYQVLRKTYGSWLIRSGLVPIEYVSKFLGHNDVTTTQGWYIGLRGSDYGDRVSKALKGLI